eukprot:749870-Hanusia_phi.AAC.1
MLCKVGHAAALTWKTTKVAQRLLRFAAVRQNFGTQRLVTDEGKVTRFLESIVPLRQHRDDSDPSAPLLSAGDWTPYDGHAEERNASRGRTRPPTSSAAATRLRTGTPVVVVRR